MSTNSSMASSTRRSIAGTMQFGDFEGLGAVTVAIDESGQPVQLPARQPATGEAEMRYHIEFATPDARQVHL